MFPQLLCVSQFLENHPAVTDVKFFDKAGATKPAIAKWEAANQPYRLPDDLASFLAISDGLLLKWSILLNKVPIRGVGNTHINSLSQIVRFQDSTLDPSKAAFVLDNSPSIAGRICLLYEKENPAAAPNVWIQGLGCTWHFVANTFTDYFRLLIMHLGLPCWCHTYTDTGLPCSTEEWFGFLSPERYHIDLMKGIATGSPKRPPLFDIDKVTDLLDRGTPAGTAGGSSNRESVSKKPRSSKTDEESAAGIAGLNYRPS